MASRKRSIGLIAFLKGSTDPKAGMPGCANYDHHYSGCLYGGCLAEAGQRCGYFEKAVLPIAGEIGQQKIYAAYESLTGADPLARPQARLCPDCGAELKPRQRYCDDCKRKRRRQSYRNSRLMRNS